ncbi:MAG: hypothetical protein HZA15_10105 [Nitrospirae bacterium]|nr:hypothetical protein [Nitrospirota bacterium]
MNRQKKLTSLVFLVICSFAAACGGGSDSSSSRGTPVPAPNSCDSKIPPEQWPNDRYADVSFAMPPEGYGSIIAWAVVTIGATGESAGKVTVKGLNLWEVADGKTSLIASSITCPLCDSNNIVWGFTLEKSLWRVPSAWSKPSEGSEFSISPEGYVVVPAGNHPTRLYHFWNTLWPRPVARQGARYYVTADALIEGNAIMQIGADYWQSPSGGSLVEAMNSDWYCSTSAWQTLSIGN